MSRPRKPITNVINEGRQASVYFRHPIIKKVCRFRLDAPTPEDLKKNLAALNVIFMNPTFWGSPPSNVPESVVKEWNRIAGNLDTNQSIHFRSYLHGKKIIPISEFKHIRSRETYRLRREMCINHYGGMCAHCGESRYEFLQIDHIHGRGNEHRRQIPGGKLHDFLIKNNYPGGYQILCASCNWAKGVHGFNPKYPIGEVKVVSLRFYADLVGGIK